MLTPQDVHRIATLARIEVSDAEATRVQGQLNGILAMIEQMQAVPTDTVEPMSHAQDLGQRLREDRVTEVDQREAFQGIAPQVADGLYLVPRVIE